MDITRYIGLFLLKNKFCYIHGLGNLSLIKRPATPDGEMLKGPEYVVQLTPTGSIDDNLANFIAVNEQISIAKASNALRDFSIQARAELQEGRDVPIPGLGYFVQRDQQILFITDPHLQYAPPAIPVVKMAKKAEENEEKKLGALPANEDVSRAKAADRTKTFIWILILATVTAGIVFGIKFITDQTNNDIVSKPEVVVPAAVVEPEPSPLEAETTTLSDSSEFLANEPASENPAEQTERTIITSGNQISYEVVINEYDNLPRAEKREKQLTGFGNTVHLRTKDSSKFYIVMPIVSPAEDTTRVIDSLRRLFNPQGTLYLYR